MAVHAATGRRRGLRAWALCNRTGLLSSWLRAFRGRQQRRSLYGPARAARSGGQRKLGGFDISGHLDDGHEIVVAERKPPVRDFSAKLFDSGPDRLQTILWVSD
jgi:hypothetical protein